MFLQFSPGVERGRAAFASYPNARNNFKQHVVEQLKQYYV